MSNNKKRRFNFEDHDYDQLALVMVVFFLLAEFAHVQEDFEHAHSWGDTIFTGLSLVMYVVIAIWAMTRFIHAIEDLRYYKHHYEQQADELVRLKHPQKS